MTAIGSLVGNSAIPTSPSYCTATDVARILQKALPSEHADEGEPSLTAWNEEILNTEDEIDQTCKTSWRLRRELLEYSDFKVFFDEEFWLLINLRNKPVRTLDAAQGDGLEIRQGGVWVDYLSQFTQGPNGQFWIEEPSGFLRVRRGPFEYTDQARLRVSYRYGISVVPRDIKLATALLTAAQLATGELVSIGGAPGSGLDRIAIDPRVKQWQKRAYMILSRHQKWEGS